MSRIMVYLDEVRCLDTEDVTGADEFYVVGAVKTSNGQNSKGFVTRPVVINDNQTKKFGPGGGYVYDSNLPSNGYFQVEMIAFDEDAAKSVSRYDQAKQVIDQSLAAVPNPISSAVGSIPFNAVRSLILLDQDDQLGADSKPFSVEQLPAGWTMHRALFREDGLGWSTWNYQVTYWVGKF